MKWLLFLFSITAFSKEVFVHEHGFWVGDGAVYEHQFDRNLAEALANFFLAEKAERVVDFGCGMGHYVHVLQKKGISCEGFDGHPDTERLSGGIARVLDLSLPFDLVERFDWVLCLEVGEHLPQRYEQTFLENLDRHNTKGIILSWALKGQGGFGHFNEQPNEYIKSRMAEFGYVNDLKAEAFLRKQAHLPWFKNTIMVFRK